MNEKGIDLRGARLLLVDDVPANLDVRWPFSAPGCGVGPPAPESVCRG